MQVLAFMGSPITDFFDFENGKDSSVNVLLDPKTTRAYTVLHVPGTMKWWLTGSSEKSWPSWSEALLCK